MSRQRLADEQAAHLFGGGLFAFQYKVLYAGAMTIEEAVLAALKPWEDRGSFNARDARTDVMAAVRPFLFGDTHR